MPIDQFLYRLDPYRANYNALYPTGESRWECLAKDVVRSIDVGMNKLALSGNKLCPCYPLPAINCMLVDGFHI